MAKVGLSDATSYQGHDDVYEQILSRLKKTSEFKMKLFIVIYA